MAGNQDVLKIGMEIDYNPALQGLGKVDNALSTFQIKSAKKIAFDVDSEPAAKRIAALGKAFDGSRFAADAALQSQKSALSQLIITGKEGSAEFEDIAKKLKSSKEEADKLALAYDRVEREILGIGQATETPGGKPEKPGETFTKAFQFSVIQQGMTQLFSTVSSLSAPFVALDTATANLKTLGAEAAAMAPSLRAAAITMSQELPFAASDIQTAMFDALASGVKGGEEGLKSFAATAAKLATGGGAELSQATGLLASNLNAYGKSAEDAGKFSDIFFNTINFGVTSAGELSSTLANVIPTAAAAGVELENVGAALAVMTAKGVPTAQSTTKLNAMLIEIQKPGAELAKVLKAAGVSMETLKQDDLPVTLAKIQKGLEATGKTATTAFSSSEAGAAFNVLAGDLKGFQDTFEGVRDTAGSADNAYKEMAGSVQVQTNQMKAILDSFIIGGLDKLGTGFVTVTQTAATLGPTISTLAGIGSILPEGAFDKAKSGFTDLAKKAGDTTILKDAGKKWEGFFKGLNTAKDKAFELGGKAIDLIPDSVLDKATGALSKVAGAGSALAGKMVPIGRAISSALLGPIGLGIAAVGLALTYFFTQTETGAAVFEKIKAYAVAAFEFVKAGISGAAEAITKFYKLDFSGAAESLKSAFDAGTKAGAESLRNSELEAAAEDMRKVVGKDIEIKAKLNTAESLPKLNEQLKETESKMAALEVKVQSGKASSEEIAELDALKTKAAETSEKILAIAPDAVENMRSVVTSSGEILSVYDFADEKVNKFADSQKKLFDPQIKANQAAYTADLNKTLELYDQQKAQLDKVGDALAKAQQSGDTESAKKLADEYGELQKKAAETGANIRKALKEGTDQNILEVGNIKIPDNVKGEFGAQVEGLLKVQEEKARNSKIGEAVAGVLKVKTDLDDQDHIGKLVEKYNNAKTEVEKNSFAEAIKAKMPDAVETINQVVDAQGNVTGQLQVNTAKVKENVEENKKRFSGDLKQKQDEYYAGLKKEGVSYQENIAKLRALKDSGQENTEEFKKLQSSVQGSAQSILQMAVESKKFGTDGKASYQAVAQAMGISEAEARKLVEAQAANTKEAGNTADKVRDIAAAFKQAKSDAAGLLDSSTDALAQIQLDRAKVLKGDAEVIKTVIDGASAASVAQAKEKFKNILDEAKRNKQVAIEILRLDEIEYAKKRDENRAKQVQQNRAHAAVDLDAQMAEKKALLDARVQQDIEANNKARGDAEKEAERTILDERKRNIRLLEIKTEYAEKEKEIRVKAIDSEIKIESGTAIGKAWKLALENQRTQAINTYNTLQNANKKEIDKINGEAALQLFKQKEGEEEKNRQQLLKNAENNVKILEQSKLQEGETLEARAIALGNARIELLKEQNKAELEIFVNSNSKVKEAQLNLENAIKGQNAEAIKSARATLDDIKKELLPEDIRTAQEKVISAALAGNTKLFRAGYDQLKQVVTDPQLLFTLQQEAAKVLDLVIKNEQDKETARLNAIPDLAARERELRINAARQTYQEEINLAGENTALQIQALNKFLAEKQKAIDEFNAKSNLLYGFSLDVQSNLREAFDQKEDSARQRALEKEIDDLDKQQDDLKKQLLKGKLTQEEYQDELVRLAQERADKEKEIEQNKFNFIKKLNEGLAKSFKKLSDDNYAQAQDNYGKFILLDEAQADYAGKIQKAQSDAMAAGFEGRLNDQAKYLERAKELEDESSLAYADALKSREKAFIQFGIAAGAQFAQLIFENGKVGQAFVKTAFSSLKALIPVFITEILAKYLVTLGPIGGPLAAAGASALLYGSLSVAEAAATRGFRLGGLSAPGEKFIRINEDGGHPEFITNPKATQINLSALTEINKRNITVEQYVDEKRAPVTEALVQNMVRREVNAHQKAVIASNNHVVKAVETLISHAEATNNRLQTLENFERKKYALTIREKIKKRQTLKKSRKAEVAA